MIEHIMMNPTFIYLTLIIGIYGIFFELVNPGFIIPGVVGGIAILVAIYSMQSIQVNYVGLGLILLGIIFIIAEVFSPSYGILGLLGTGAFIIGSVLLIDSGEAGYHIAWSAIGAMAVANIIVLVLLLNMAIKSKRKPLQHGTEVLIGQEGRALGAIHEKGQVMIDGEIWSVHATSPIQANRTVVVIALKGLCLEVAEKVADHHEPN